MPPVLPPSVRRAWLRRFGAETRVESWPSGQPSVRAARITDEAMMEIEEGLVVPQNREILLFEAGALGDVAPDDIVVHDGVRIRLETGPTPLPSDRAWEYWVVVP